MKVPITPFARAWDTLTKRQQGAIRARCSGEEIAEVAMRQGVSSQTIKMHCNHAFDVLRGVPGLTDTSPHTVLSAVCWRLGYEQALSDIDAHLAKKQRAA